MVPGTLPGATSLPDPLTEVRRSAGTAETPPACRGSRAAAVHPPQPQRLNVRVDSKRNCSFVKISRSELEGAARLSADAPGGWVTPDRQPTPRTTATPQGRRGNHGGAHGNHGGAHRRPSHSHPQPLSGNGVQQRKRGHRGGRKHRESRDGHHGAAEHTRAGARGAAGQDELGGDSIGQMNAWNTRSLLHELHSLVAAQTEALTVMTAAIQQLAGSISRTSHINSRRSARGSSSAVQGQFQSQFQPAKDDFELNGLQASAKIKLQAIIKARESAHFPQNPIRSALPSGVQESGVRGTLGWTFNGTAEQYKSMIRAEEEAEKRREQDKAQFARFQQDTARLKTNLDSVLATAMDKMRQYEKTSHRRHPCQALNDLIRHYNSDTKWCKESHCAYTFHQDGTVADSTSLLIDPGIFWTTELVYKPRPKVT